MTDPAARLRLKKGDITSEAVDAVVNAANCRLAGGGGVDGAIHRAAGPALAAACAAVIARLGRLETGRAVITPAGNMKARFVIHTPGPVWKGGLRGEEAQLRSCYRESLALALGRGLRTVAFPSISTGVYGYPPEIAAPAALGEVAAFLNGNAGIELALFVLYDDRTLEIYQKALRAIGGAAARTPGE